MNKIVAAIAMVYIEWKISDCFARVQQATNKIMIHVKLKIIHYIFFYSLIWAGFQQKNPMTYV
jgi:hypothetical protein